MASVNAAVPGDAWAVSEGVLKQLARRALDACARRPQAGEEMRGAVPIGAGRVVVLFALARRRLRPGALDLDDR